MAYKESDLQLIVGNFQKPHITLASTSVLEGVEYYYSLLLNALTFHLPISNEGTTLKTVEEFRYHGSVISIDCLLEKEISVRSCKPIKPLDICIHEY